MNIQKQIVEFSKRYGLKEKALASIDEVLDASIDADKEIGIDFLEGNNRSDLIYEFGRSEFRVDKNGNSLFATKINIYSKKFYGPNFDVPVGFYIELTDVDGKHIDEFLNFDWSPFRFDIAYYIERISSVVPRKYLRRNVPQYEFVSYVNHVISLFQGRNFNESAVFIKRSLDYLDRSEKKEIQNDYLKECLGLYKGIYWHIKNHELIIPEKLSQYRINDRIEMKSKL